MEYSNTYSACRHHSASEIHLTSANQVTVSSSHGRITFDFETAGLIVVISITSELGNLVDRFYAEIA